jgi:hypothetical protein
MIIFEVWHGSHIFEPLPSFFDRFLPFSEARQVEHIHGGFPLLDDHTAGDSSVEGLIEAQRRCAVSANPFERVVGSLLMAARLRKCLSVLPDEAIGQLLFEYVWNVMDVFSPELVISEVATQRLLRKPMQQGNKEDRR